MEEQSSINMTKHNPWKDMKKLGELVNSYTGRTSIEDALKTRDIVHFHKMPYGVIDALIKEGYADPRDCQNSSPSMKEFRNFMKRHSGIITAHGYIILPPRDDARVTVEGCEGVGLSPEAMQEVIEEFRHADDFNFDISGGEFYAWWD